MNPWLALILSVLAVYRISYLIAKEDGPFDLFAKIRYKGGSIKHPHDWISRGLNCILCISFWLSLIPVIWLFWGDVVSITLGWLGIAGGVLVLYKVFDEQLA